MLLQQPQFYGTSDMFALPQVDGFAAILRKKAASLIHRIRGGYIGLLTFIANRVQDYFYEPWTRN